VTPAAMQEHVLAILTDHEITYSFHPRKAWAAVDIWEVQIQPIKSALSYATALHEIDHLLGRHRHSRRSLVRERDAWNWARRNAQIWTPTMERHAEKCLAWSLRASDRALPGPGKRERRRAGRAAEGGQMIKWSPSRIDARDRREAAFHEAGHAVMARYLGTSVLHVDIRRSGEASM
jgi:hypothetical protein